MQRLRQRGDAHAVSVLEPYLHALASAPNAATTMRWMHGPTMALLTDLLAGRLAVTHAALDEAQGSAADCGSVAFLRAALTHHGVLEQRDEASASFARWHQHATMSVVSTVDRAHVRAYATWQVAHQLATATPRRPPSPSQQKLARSQVRQAITLAAWLHMQHLQLSDLRQDLIDTWVTQGSSTRRSVRPFVSWLERCGVTGRLDVAWNRSGHGPAPLSDRDRFAMLRRLLLDSSADSRDRFAGGMLLLYGQRLSHTVALTVQDITTVNDQVAVTLGRGPILLPEPLGAIARELRDAAAASDRAWLFGGRIAGRHLTAERVRVRLKAYGITSRQGRQGALLALAAKLPAAILAERIGIYPARAAQWVRAAGATYDDYVTLRTS